MLFNSLFGRKNSASSTSYKSAKLNKKNHQPRRVAFEPLESRDLLTVTMGEPVDDAVYNEIRAAYPDFELSEYQSDLNVITITPEDDGSLLLSDLQAAIYAAGESDSPDLILVMTSADSNTITYTSAADELAIDISYISSDSVTIIGWGPENLTLNANQQSRVMIISDSSTVNLGGLTITGGNSSASLINSETYGEYAGGIGSLGTLTIENCTITGNTASGYGGGIASSGTLRIVDSLISNNTTTGTDEYSGGGGIASSGDTTIINSEISNNEAASGAGIINSEGTLLIYGSVISQNTATSEYSSGGGIVNSQGTLDISNSVISDNSALNGGGIYNWGMVTVTKSEIINNTADGIGGGICNDYGTCTVISSTVSGNRSDECGGGIYCWWEDSDLTVMNSEISGNESSQGGGIFNKGVTYVYNSTISANTAESGGGVYNSDSLTVTNSTIAGNALTESSDGEGAGIYSSGAATINNSIIVDDIVNEDGYGTITGAYNLSVYSGWSADSYNIAYNPAQPLFVDAENGDYHLAADSQAIDRGNNDLAVDSYGDPLTNDQSGRLRINNDVVDIGAHEYKESISDYAAIRSKYAEFELPESEYDVNIIVVDLTAGDGLYELQAAIVTAGGTFQSDLIVVYTSDEANTLTNSDYENALYFEIDSDEFGSVTLVSWGDSKLTLDANFDGNVIYDYGNETVVNLGGLTLVNGYAGVYNEYGTVCVAQCDISGNNDGICNYNGALTILDSSVKNSENNGILNYSGKLTVASSVLSQNAGFQGGAISNDLGIVTITDSLISDNTAQGEGGAIYNGFGTLTVLNSEISDNKSNNMGGAIYNSHGMFTVLNSKISGNKSSMGGAIIGEGGTLTVMNSEISENIANYDGGGIYGYFEKVLLTNSVIAGNTAIYGGGSGIYAGSGSITVTNCTIAGNSAQYEGAGFYNSATTTINNSIIVDDIVNEDSYGIITGSNNLSAYSGWSDDSYNIAYDASQPLFLDADNGDYHLTDGALAIDAGNNALAVDAKGVALAYDRDGAERISNGKVDIGAYEFVLDSSTLARPVLSTPIFEDDGSVTVSWSNVNNASGYLFEYKLTSDADWTSIDTTEQSFSLDLPDGQAYKVRVKALGGDDYNDSAFSAEKLIYNYDNIREKYTDFYLPESEEDINTIVVDLTAGDDLAKLKKAIQKAGKTEQDDLILVLTSNDANTLTFTSSDDTLLFDAYSEDYVAVNIISLGDSNLVIDANDLCRAISVGSGNYVNLGGLTITNGLTTMDDGSAIANYGMLTVSFCTITDNYTPNCGAILNGYNGGIFVTNSSISGNVSVTSGGGIYNYGYLEIINSVITDNSSNVGGGICSVTSTSAVITCSTIAGNYADQGAGIYNSGVNLYAGNSIIVDEIVNSYGDIAGNNNLSTFTGWAYGDDNLSYDPSKPLFVNAANGDYHLAAGSQAIDMGDNDVAADSNGTPFAYDLDGNARIVNGTVDIGAYEYQASVEPIQYSSVVTTLNDSFDLNDDEWSLREAIYYAPESEYVTITFADDLFVEGPGTIFLTQGELVIDQAIVIDGDGLITIDANQQSRVFNVTAGTEEQPVVLDGLTIQNGYAEEMGGGISVANGYLVVDNSLVTGNSAMLGGGINNESGAVTIVNSMISENESEDCGGGISSWSGSVTIINSAISGNTGDGVYCFDNTLTIIDSKITENTAFFGAGIQIEDGGDISIVNSLIADNTAVYRGGAIYNHYGALTITNSTIAGNKVTCDGEFTDDYSEGGGIYNWGSVTFNSYNSIIACNTYCGADSDIYTSPVDSTEAVVNGCNTLSSFTKWDNAGDSVNWGYKSTNPLFVDAANGDYHLIAGSQAIDMGDNELAVDEDGAPLTVDLDGDPRIVSDAVDIGAYEYSEYKSIYNDIRSKYSVFDLPESMADINIIVVDLTAGDGLADLKAAIATAGETELPDLIVVYTSDDANTLTYESADDELLINIDASQKGSVTIVGWGSKNLTLNANENCRVLTTTAALSSKLPVVNLGGLTITGGNSHASKSNTDKGGGILNYYGNVTISNCSFVDNTASNGGGIYNWYILSVVNSAFVENSAEYGGGGIYSSYDNSIDSSLDSFAVTNCTISGNSAAYGGGIYDSDSRLKMTNSIVSANYASQSGSNLNPPSIDTSHNNIIGGSYGLFVNAPFFDSEGNLTNADTVDLHLRSDSRAVDAGDNAAASGFDADGAARIFGESVDIGAYEFQGDRDDQPLPSSSVVTTLDDSFDPNDGVLSLREAIYYTAGYKTITFADDLNGTITLSQGQLVIDNALVIDGDGRITIDADHNSRVISVEAGTSETPVVLNGLTIQNGETDSNSSGGGIYNIGTLAVSNCTVTGNVSSSSGGGIYNEGVLTVMNSYILRNEALEDGGGIYNTQMSDSSNHASMTILNSVISENTVTDDNSYGAGIYNYKADLTVTNCTIAGNSSSYSCGGLYNYGELALTNSIITSNYDKNGHSNLSTLDAETSHNNLIGYYGLFVNEPVFDSQGNLTNADTMDLHLRSDSSAIGAGDNSLASGLDADGNARIYGEAVDIGAYEYQGDQNDDPIPYSNVVTTLDDIFDPNDGVWSLREAIYYAPEYVTITFASNLNGTVTLTQGELKINKALAIDGEGRIVIDANQKSRAILVDAGSLENPVIINGLTIQNGFTEDYNEGAGIFNSSGVLTVSNCSILNNSSYAGAGIFSSNGNLTISNSVIRGNSAQYGAGILTTYDDLSITITTITNSVIVENTAGSSGGGIYNESALTLTNCTIAHNFASYTKDGIINFDNITVNNTIITDYILNESYYNDGGSISGSNNLSTFTDWTSGDNNIEYDSFKPLFIDEEGGDYHLAAGSQAIDMGANALAVDANNNALIFDLDGAARIVNDKVDIGAYESNLDSSALLTPTLNEPTFDDTILTVTWTDVPNASGYQFEYKNATDSDWTVMDVSNPSASFNYNYELGYKIRVKALGGSDNNNSAYSSTYTIDPDYSINYNRIRAKYSDFDLPESQEDINIIVVDLTAGDNLSDLKTAITTAGGTTLPDLIVVLTSDDANSLRYSSSSSELNINIDAEQYGSVTIVSWGPENFTLNARQYSRVMTVSGSSTVVNLGGMTFTNGKSANSSSNSNYGGGILNMYATLTISDCTFTNNTSTYGGGIFSYGDSTVNIIGSEFSGNSATTDGGGIYGGDKSNVTVTDCTVSGNSAIYGAGIYNGSSVTMTVINCQILDNTASTSGGGLFNTQNSTLIVTDSVISGNKGTTRGGGFTNYYGAATFINSEFANNTGNNGGGIYNGGSSYGSTLTLYGSTISGNTSSSSGGGIYNSSDGTLTVNTSKISGNTSSTNGGGIYNSSSSNLTLTNSEISGNTASNYGGGIINYGDSLVITNSTIAGNSSRIGGGIDNNNNKPLTVTNSIISSNYSTDNLNIASPNFDTEHHNLIGSYYGLFVKAPMFDSEGNLTNADTMDLHLRTYSAAIDAGDNDAASGLVTDIDGKTRIYGDNVDIGAYEYQGDRVDKPIIYSSVVNTLNDSFDPDDDEWSLREAICYATEYVTITFAENLSGTVALTLGQLTIDNPLAIDGDGRIVIDANQKSRIFTVNAGTTENPVVLNGLTIQNGSSKNDGGGILNSGTLMVTNSAIAGNSANYGGGIYNDGDALTVVNCTIAGNSASYFGGGIYVDYDCPLTVINSIVSSNYAADGASNISAYNLDETSHHNLISSYYGQFVNAPVFDSQGVLTNADTMDLHLRSDSIAINAGDNTAAAAFLKDADGANRIFGETVDIGAYEYLGDRDDEPIPYSAVVNTLNDSFDPNDGEWSLREAIYYATEYVTITFADNLDGTILLERGQLVVDKALIIDGDGLITIDADKQSRVFNVTAGTSENPVVLNGLTIQNGCDNSSYGQGGGINNSGVLTVSNSTITGNESELIGGGIYNDGILVVANTVIENNLSGYGGGIGNSNTLTITNSSFTNNTAYRFGGAIRNVGVLSIVNSAITDNVLLSSNSDTGGGIANFNTLTITNCTIAGNSYPDGPTGIFNSAELSVNNSIIADGISSVESDEITVSGSNNLSTFTGWSSGSDNFDYNSTKPLFVDAENGDYHLIAGSQAIDRGNNDLAVDEDGVELEFDMDGNARISGKFVDIGAYEYVQPEVDYDAIRSKYSDFDLPESVDDINIIVVDLTSGEDLDCLKNAIELAGVTTMPDLIVAITSNDANTLTYADSTDELIINIDASQYGSVTIVSWGDSDLTLDANQECRVASVVDYAVANLGGLTIMNGVLEFDGGAGVYIDGGASVTISDCGIFNNSAWYGGGVCNDGGSLTILNSYVEHNRSEVAGGGIYCWEECTLEILNSTISGNNASQGGGIFNKGSLSIVNSLIADNIAEDYGGGLCNSEGTLTVTNSTIAGNSAALYGGGISNSARVELYNSIVACNSADSGADIFSYEHETVAIFGYKSLSSFTDWTDNFNTFEYDSTLPLFVNSERGNYRLTEDSQAIDKGNNQYALDAGLDESSKDLAGKLRFNGDAIDLGAYEFNKSIDFVGAVSKQINVYNDTNEIPDSVSQLTDWNRFYLELWTADVSEFAAGDTFEAIVTYNPQFHQLDAAQTISTPNGVTAEITDQTVEDDGTVTVIITFTVSDGGYTAPGSNTYWGSVLFTPSTAEGSGTGNQNAPESLGVAVNGYELETTLIAMPYDFNNDNQVDIEDFIKFATVFGYKPGSLDVGNPLYYQAYQADFDASGVVDVQDFIAFATNFGIKKGKNYNIQLPEKVNAAPAAPAQMVESEPVIEEQPVIQTPAVTPQSAEIVEVVVTVQEQASSYLMLAQPAQAESAQTLRQAHSTALLDLYDNQNSSETIAELSAPAIDAAIYQDDDFDFLFDATDSADSSDVDLSVVLDELELELI